MGFNDFLTAHQSIGYVIAFLGIALEGEVTLFTAAFLASRGYFDPVFLFALAFAGAIIGDNIWYVLGEIAREKNRFSKIRRLAEKATGSFDEHLKSHPMKTFFVSKFAWGLHRPIVFKSGILKVPFGSFLKGNAIATAVWIFFVGGLGYLSSVVLGARRYLRYTEISLLSAILVFVLISKLLTKLSEKEL